MRRVAAFLTVGPLTLALVGNCGGGGSSGGIAGYGTGAQGGTTFGGSAGIDADGSSTGGIGASQTGGTGGIGGGQGGTGASSDSGVADVEFKYDASEPDATICVDETAKAEPVPLDIYFMLDASTSMSSPAGLGAAGDCNAAPPFTPTVNSRWCKAINAIAGYVSSADAVNNRAALQYFSVYSGHNCNGVPYATPAVGLGLLPGNFSGHAQTLVQQSPGGLNWAYPHNATPTEGALRGLAQFTAANKTAGRLIIGILVTDGIPSSCSTTDATLKGIAQNHFNATGIHTFMVGITGANFTRLENWASYTGALSHDDTNDACGNCNACTCHHYNVGDGSPAVFIAALKAIQNAVLSCTFQVPAPATGLLNPDAVKVDYMPGGQPPAIELPRVANAAACSGPGWYYEYDAAMQPTTINLCPTSCNTVQADVNASVNIRIACQGS
jgi:hypothetical protein